MVLVSGKGLFLPTHGMHRRCKVMSGGDARAMPGARGVPAA
jgi:hypothetical protein